VTDAWPLRRVPDDRRSLDASAVDRPRGGIVRSFSIRITPAIARTTPVRRWDDPRTPAGWAAHPLRVNGLSSSPVEAAGFPSSRG